uniref:Uncharacterized protein n=1 Tax=viral metagenome TaxID=1070528 RepID=A0A6C0F0M8_9ZZZZ
MNWNIIFLLICAANAFNCSWDYRFDSVDNHFNIVYPDKNAVYFGMIIPPGSSSFRVTSDDIHPIATYFSIQVYEIGGVAYHYNDADLVELTQFSSPYDLQLNLENETQTYFALFRIYDSRLPFADFWSGIPPKTFIDEREYVLCNIDYNQQGNISTNFTQTINPETGTVCQTNGEFLFMPVPPGSLANADANYMIACVESGNTYTIRVKLPTIMCSLIYGESPHVDEDYDLRYASMSLVSTTAPRPTISTYKLPCNTTDYEITIDVPANTTLPAFLYRQLLPDPNFKYSIEQAKQRCAYSYHCIHAVMGEFYPEIDLLVGSRRN